MRPNFAWLPSHAFSFRRIPSATKSAESTSNGRLGAGQRTAHEAALVATGTTASAALQLAPGDRAEYVVRDYEVVLRKAHGSDSTHDPLAVFSEWDSPADRAAYANL